MQTKNFQQKSVQSSNPRRFWVKLFSIITIIAVIPILIFHFFRITEVLVIADEINISEDVLKINADLKNKYIGANLLMVDQNEVQSIISNNIGRYQITNFEKFYPSKLEIKISKILSIYYVKANNGNFGISEEFQVVEFLNEPNKINYVVYNGNINLGQKLEDQKLIEGLKYSSIDKSVVTVDGSISIIIDPEIKVYLPENGDINSEEVLELLKKILQKYSIENKVIESIDLRFKEPVIKFK